MKNPQRRWLGAALCLLLCAGLCAASADALRGYDASLGYQYVELGTYPQTLEAGLEPILWRVLAVDADRAYLLSEYVLCHHRLDSDDVAYVRNGGDFAQTEMYGFLNGEFLSHFTEAEQAMLLPDANGGLITLLTRDDLKNKAYGFTSDYARRGLPTAYALNNGLFQYTNGSSPYWTCTQSTSHDYGGVCTKQDGNLGYIRVVVQNEGCRPALYLNINQLAIESGSGTTADPFRFALAETRGVEE